jgi:polysaccharide export outer membrane protein
MGLLAFREFSLKLSLRQDRGRGRPLALLTLCILSVTLVACQSVRRDLPTVATLPDAATVSTSPYLIQPGDVLETHFIVDSTLNEQVVVAPDGRVSFFYAADIAAAGHTLRQLRDSVAQKAGITDPSFLIALRNSVGTRVYVTGEVNTPGEIVVNGQISALQAISRAGGYKLGAQKGLSVLLRRDSANKPVLYSVNLESAADGRQPNEDVLLQPYDIIYVPRDRIANLSLIFERIHNAVPFSVYYGINKVATNGVF